MADNVIEFKKKDDNDLMDWMAAISLYQSATGELGVSMEVSEAFTEAEIFECLMAMTIQYGIQEGILEDDETDTDTIVH